MRLIRPRVAQTAELARYRGGRELVEDREKVGAANAGDIERGPLKNAQQPLFDGIEEIDAFDGLAGHDARCGQTIERPGAGREIVESGEEGEITTIAAKQDLAKVGQAVDGARRSRPRTPPPAARRSIGQEE